MALVCPLRPWRGGCKPPATRVDDNLLYKTTLPPDIDDCSGRQESEKEGWWSAMANKAYSLSHTKWMCKYHIVFTPKYRRKAIYGQIRSGHRGDPEEALRVQGRRDNRGHLMPDHVHMLLAIPPKYSVSSVMGYLKGKSSLMIFDKHANLKYKFGNRRFWAEGYYVSTVGAQRGDHREVHQGAGGRRHRAGQAERQGVLRPVQEVAGYSPVRPARHGSRAIGPEQREGRRL